MARSRKLVYRVHCHGRRRHRQRQRRAQFRGQASQGAVLFNYTDEAIGICNDKKVLHCKDLLFTCQLSSVLRRRYNRRRSRHRRRQARGHRAVASMFLHTGARYQSSHRDRHIRHTVRSRTNARVPSQRRGQRPHNRTSQTTYRAGTISRTDRSRRSKKIYRVMRRSNNRVRRHTGHRGYTLTNFIKGVTYSETTRR